jgi:hypothetical protein
MQMLGNCHSFAALSYIFSLLFPVFILDYSNGYKKKRCTLVGLVREYLQQLFADVQLFLASRAGPEAGPIGSAIAKKLNEPNRSIGTHEERL